MRPFLLALLALLAFAPSARAGVVSIDDATRTLIVVGDPGPNVIDVQVSEFRGTYTTRVRELADGVDGTAGSPQCEADSVGYVECRTSYPPTEKLLGGGGDDRLELSEATFVPSGHVVDGGEGNDEVNGGNHADQLLGGPGNDVLRSDGGPVIGLLPTAGGDVMSGGDGIDEVSYQQTGGQSYSLTLDGQANDGALGENDNIGSDVENLTGSVDHPSTLVGNDGPNALRGFSANDVLTGNGGNDVLDGDAGNDVLDGGAGDDQLTGGSEDDRLTGGPGTDAFSADFSGAYNQTIVGNDQVFARDGVTENVACGPGADTAQVDATDVVAADPQNGCESVDRAAAANPIRSSSLRVRKNRVSLSVGCPAGGAGCVGTVRIRSASKVKVGRRRATVTFASGSYSIAAGAKKTVRLKVGAKGRSVLRRTRKLRVRVELRAPGAKKATATRTVTLRR